MSERYALFVFDSTHSAIAAQKLLLDLGAIVIPTLREISASCGVSVRLAEKDAKAAAERLRLNQIQYWHLYDVETVEKRTSCTLLKQWDDAPKAT